MKKAQLFTAGIFFLIFSSFTSDQLPRHFADLLNRAKMIFVAPEGMTETKCIKNKQMNYEFALKYPDKNFEVRYTIRPMDSALAQYERSQKKGDLMIHPNKWSATSFQATLLNIGLGGTESGKLPDISYFDSTAVKNEFNADWGATAFVNLGEEFGGDKYKYCLAVIIHKDNIGDGYFFYLGDDNNKIGELMKSSFHSLRFK